MGDKATIEDRVYRSRLLPTLLRVTANTDPVGGPMLALHHLVFVQVIAR
jgi:hypothetical protein